MTKLNEIDSRLKELLTNNTNEIDGYAEKMNTADKAIQDANDQLKNAESNVNVDDYNTAKNNIWAAKHAKELYGKTKEKLEKKPLINREQYNSILKEIKESADAEQDALNKKAIDLIAKIHSLADESRDVTNKANELMNTLQRKVYKEAEGKIYRENGTSTWSADKTYNAKITVSGFYNSKIKGTPLSKLAGEEEKQERNHWGM